MFYVAQGHALPEVLLGFGVHTLAAWGGIRAHTLAARFDSLIWFSEHPPWQLTLAAERTPWQLRLVSEPTTWQPGSGLVSEHTTWQLVLGWFQSTRPGNWFWVGFRAHNLATGSGLVSEHTTWQLGLVSEH